MTSRALAAPLLLAVTGLLANLNLARAADAQPQALHDKPWYAAHDAARQATLRVCYGDNSYAHLYDCQNAADAEIAVRGRSLAARSNFLADPRWWASSRTARNGYAGLCREGSGPAYDNIKAYCPLIFAARIQAGD